MVDISFWQLGFGYLILLLPIVGLWLFRTGLIKSLLIGASRMTVQLLLVGVYLGYLFELNNAWINIVWVIVMIFVGALTVSTRTGVNKKMFVLPFIIAGFTSLVIIDSFFLGAIIQLDYFFDARYFIPISGMILGNSMNHNIVGISAYFDGLVQKEELYNFLLANTNDRKAALTPFVQDALKKALNPMIANMSVMGLISLPGMMTGQILGGSSPAEAIKYQIMIMLAILTGCSLNLFLSLYFSNKYAFNKYGALKKGIIVQKKIRPRN
ncbi:MAG: ABC transporter permease [Marinilabiliaceae bacterium]|nr:ABC transporter permease [Marinilabiliaceae bacterium]